MMIFMAVVSFLSMLIMGYFLRVLFPFLQGKRQSKQDHYLEILSLLDEGALKKACDYAALTASSDVYDVLKRMVDGQNVDQTEVISLMRKELKLK